MPRSAALIVLVAGVVALPAIFYGYTVWADNYTPHLRWNTRHIGYWVNLEGSGLTYQDVQGAISNSFDAWSHSGIGITFEFMGLTSAKHDVNDGKNTLYWDTSGKDVSKDGLGEVSSVGYKPSTGEITDVDIAFRGQNLPALYVTDVSLRCGPSSIVGVHIGGVPIVWAIGRQGLQGLPWNSVFVADVQATLTHEIGHLLGLDHSNVDGATMSTMANPSISPQFNCGTDQKNLKSDDIDGARFLYPGTNQQYGWLKMSEGDPGLPGDGVYVTASGPAVYPSFHLTPQPRLANVQDGLVIVAFPRPGVMLDGIAINTTAPSKPVGCQPGFSASFSRRYFATVIVDGVEGLLLAVSRGNLETITAQTEQSRHCGFTLDDMVIDNINVGTTELDAAAVNFSFSIK